MQVEQETLQSKKNKYRCLTSSNCCIYLKSFPSPQPYVMSLFDTFRVQKYQKPQCVHYRSRLDCTLLFFSSFGACSADVEPQSRLANVIAARVRSIFGKGRASSSENEKVVSESRSSEEKSIPH